MFHVLAQRAYADKSPSNLLQSRPTQLRRGGRGDGRGKQHFSRKKCGPFTVGSSESVWTRAPGKADPLIRMFLMFNFRSISIRAR